MEDKWWLGIAVEMQSATDSNSNKEFYTLMKKAFGPKMASYTIKIYKWQ